MRRAGGLFYREWFFDGGRPRGVWFSAGFFSPVRDFFLSFLGRASFNGRTRFESNARKPEEPRKEKNVPVFIMPLLFAVIILKAAAASAASLPALEGHQKRVHFSALQLLDRPEDGDLSALFSDPRLIRDPVRFLKREKMNVFDPRQEKRLRAWAARQGGRSQG